MIRIISLDDKEDIERVKQRSYINIELAIDRVRPIIKDVKIKGDEALFYYTKKYDNAILTKNNIKVTKKEINGAYKKTGKKTVAAIKKAAENITKFSKLQLPKEWFKEINKGVKAGQIIRPIERVGCYIPCGNFPLPSTVLMTVIPAKVAGVKEIIICTPPRSNNNAILVAADICGVKEIFKVGGAQAIAALAYGISMIPKVDKIVGPGNIFVTAAKKLVYGDVGIDFLAGPSEILIIAEKGDARFIAADMLAQAEHDLLSRALLVTPDKKLAEKVKKEIEKQIGLLKTKDIAQESLRKNSAIILAKNINEAVEFSNEVAPEHLTIISKNNKKIIKKIQNAGSIFLGDYSPEAAGDYASGTNHVLPTSGAARYKSGLSVFDFIKMPTVQELTKKGLESLKDTILELSKAEGLDAHRKSVEKRFELKSQ